MKNALKLLTVLLVVFAVVLTAKAALGDVVINEVMANALDEDTGEFVELYNTDDNAGMDLKGWGIYSPGDLNDIIDDYTDVNDWGAAGTIIPAGGYAIIVDSEYAGEYNAYLNSYADPAKVIMITNAQDTTLGNGGLKGSGDTITIDDYDGYIETYTWNIDAGDGVSLAKINPTGGDAANNWKISILGGTPGVVNNVAPQFTSVPVKDAEEDKLYTYTVAADDADGDKLEFGAPNKPAWLTFKDNGDGTAALSGTPENKDVGDYVIIITVTDGILSPKPQSFILSVKNANDKPIAADFTPKEIDEDTEAEVTLGWSDEDNGDKAAECAVNDLVNGKIAEGKECTCDGAGVCKVSIMPDKEFSGEITGKFTVTDENGAASDPANLILKVNAVNDAPIIGDIPANCLIATEGVEYECEITASDIDSKSEDLFISTVVSDEGGGWLESDELTLLGTPDTIGTSKILVFVSDGEDESEQKEFSLTVNPALGIASVEVDGKAWKEGELNATPGQEIGIKVNFKNNYNKVLGHVEVQAYSDADPDFAAHEGICEGANCDEGYWALEAGMAEKDEFSFIVPWDITASQFTLTLELSYDDFWSKYFSWLLGESYTSTQEIAFNVQKEEAGIHLENAELSDSKITCGRISQLKLTLINSGTFPVTPELLVYDKEPVADSFNKITGKFAKFKGEPSITDFKTLNEIPENSGKVEQTINLDLSALPVEADKLYLYIVGPYFKDGSKYIAGSGVLEISAGPCLNIEAIEEMLITSKNVAPAGLPINLFEKDNDGAYIYIFEDKDYENQLDFSIGEKDQSNSELIDCSPIIDNVLSCNTPAMGETGTSELTINASQDVFGLIGKISEKVNVMVGNTLGINEVKINGITVKEAETSAPLGPAQEVEIKVTATNYLDHAITDVKVLFSAPGIFILSEEGINIEAGKSAVLTLKYTMDSTIVSGTYPAAIVVSGKDYNDNTEMQSDWVEFELEVKQEVADLKITKAESAAEKVICAADTGVTVELLNTGSNDEDDVILKLKSGKELSLSSEDDGAIFIAKNGGIYAYTFTVPTTELNIGDNTLTIEASYRNGKEKTTEQLSLKRESCLVKWDPVDEDGDNWWILKDGENLDLSVELAEEGYDNLIEWYSGVDTEEPELMAAGQNIFSFMQSEPGTYIVTAEVNGESQEWNFYVTAFPITSEFYLADDDDYFADKDLTGVENFVLENDYGKIAFNKPVDVSEVFDLDQVAYVGDGIAAIDSETEGVAGLNVPATITLKKTFNNQIILMSDEFKAESGLKPCPATICKQISSKTNEFVFTVTGFSTYKVVENVAAGLEISPISISDVERGTTVTTTLTIKNIGNVNALNGVKADLSGINAKYKAEVTGMPEILASGATATVTLTITVPANEDAGNHSIGSIKIISNEASKSASVYLSPKSYLKITNVDVNGDTDGELTPEKDNEVEVDVTNEYGEDMEDVTVTVSLLDVDGDDLEEEAEAFDLDKGDDDTASVKFDLANEDLDEDSYTLEITVEGEADDDSEHKTVETLIVNVDREKHKVVITEATLTPEAIECLEGATASVDVRNIGKSNEDDVEIKVKNTALSLDESQKFELDKFSGSDNTYSASFEINTEKASSGKYPITVELYRDGKKDDSTTLNLEVKECLVTSTQSQTQNTYNSAEEQAKLLQAQLNAQLAAKKAAEQKTAVTATTAPIKTSFRDSDTYVMMLAALVVLVIIAVLMGLAVMTRGKPRRKEE